MDHSKSTNEILHVLEGFFGCVLGPDEIEATRKLTDRKLLNLTDQISEFFIGEFSIPSRTEGSHRAFPGTINHREINSYCYKDFNHKNSSGEIDKELLDRQYDKITNIPSEILKLLLYYDSVAIFDPISIVCSSEFPSENQSKDLERTKLILSNAIEFFVPLRDFIKDGSIILLPELSIVSHFGKSVELDEFEIGHPKFREIWGHYLLDRPLSDFPIVACGGTDFTAILGEISKSGRSASYERLYAAWANGYLSFCDHIDADFIAQSKIFWELLKWKIDRANEIHPPSTNLRLTPTIDFIDLLDFDKISYKDLHSLRINDQAFAAWRSDIATVVALSKSGAESLDEIAGEFSELCAVTLPRRASEIASEVNRTSLRQHISDAAYSFGAAGFAGMMTEDINMALGTAAAGATSGLLMSSLFRQPKSEDNVLRKLYTALLKRDRESRQIPVL